MPYISQKSRKDLDCNIRSPQNAGELNYKLTTICLAYLKDHTNYQGYNDVFGALYGVISRQPLFRFDDNTPLGCLNKELWDTEFAYQKDTYSRGMDGIQFGNYIRGAVIGCLLELYRRAAAPYEDGKIKENGEVYPTGNQNR